MKILSAEHSISMLIETDSKEWPSFRRHSADSWENLIGESWEPVYSFYIEKLEEEYQTWLHKHKIAIVEKTSTGPKLYIAGVFVSGWLGISYNDEADNLADKINSVLDQLNKERGLRGQ